MKAWYEMTKELNGDNVDIDIEDLDLDELKDEDKFFLI